MPDLNVTLECKPRTYRSFNGLDFWYDHERRAVVTNDPTTSIRFVFAARGMDSVSFVYLTIEETRIQIAQRNGQPFPPSIYRGPNHATTWAIGSLGLPLYFNPSIRSYRSFGEADFKFMDGYEPVAIDRGFASRKQQNAAVTFIADALARYDGNWLGACRGEDQHAKVYIRSELGKQLANGELLRP